MWINSPYWDAGPPMNVPDLSNYSYKCFSLDLHYTQCGKYNQRGLETLYTAGAKMYKTIPNNDVKKSHADCLLGQNRLKTLNTYGKYKYLVHFFYFYVELNSKHYLSDMASYLIIGK